MIKINNDYIDESKISAVTEIKLQEEKDSDHEANYATVVCRYYYFKVIVDGQTFTVRTPITQIHERYDSKVEKQLKGKALETNRGTLVEQHGHFLQYLYNQKINNL